MAPFAKLSSMKLSTPVVVVLLCFGWSALSAQGSAYSERQFDDSSKGIVYEKEFSGDFRLHTNGWAVAVNFGKLQTYYKTRYYHLEFGELKHPKEFKQSFDLNFTPNTTISRSFAFGKQNSFYALRGGYGEKRYLSEKARQRGVAVGMSYQAGPVLGLLKPYYLEIVRRQDGIDVQTTTEKYSPANADLFLDVNDIYGAAGFREGLGELSVRPGVHGKFALHFDWGAFDEFVKALEAGVMVDVFFQDVPIMVENEAITNVENRPYFINLYLAFQLGKRW